MRVVLPRTRSLYAGTCLWPSHTRLWDSRDLFKAFQHTFISITLVDDCLLEIHSQAVYYQACISSDYVFWQRLSHVPGARIVPQPMGGPHVLDQSWQDCRPLPWTYRSNLQYFPTRLARRPAPRHFSFVTSIVSFSWTSSPSLQRQGSPREPPSYRLVRSRLAGGHLHLNAWLPGPRGIRLGERSYSSNARAWWVSHQRHHR